MTLYGAKNKNTEKISCIFRNLFGVFIFVHT